MIYINKKVGEGNERPIRKIPWCCVFLFSWKKRIEIHDKLKKEILSSVTQLDDLEALLINYGHPRSLALSYGYRPLTQHIFNRKYVFLVQRSVLGLSFLFVSINNLLFISFRLSTIFI